MKKRLQNFLKEEKAQAITEYVILFAIFTGFSLVLIRRFMEAFKGHLELFAKTFEKDLATGTCGATESGTPGYPNECFRSINSWQDGGG